MRQVQQSTRRPARPVPPIDLRTPLGRALPY